MHEVEKRVLLPGGSLAEWLEKLDILYPLISTGTFKTFLIGTSANYERIRFSRGQDFFTYTVKTGSGTVRSEMDTTYSFKEGETLAKQLAAKHDSYVELYSTRHSYSTSGGQEISLTAHDKLGLILEVESLVAATASQDELEQAVNAVDLELTNLGLIPMTESEYKQLWDDLYANYSEPIQGLAQKIIPF